MKRPRLDVAATKNKIQQAVNGTAAAEVSVSSGQPQLADVVQASKPPSRVGKTNITGYFDPEFKDSLRLVQVKTRRNFQQLLEEALTDLYRKHNVPVPSGSLGDK
jgi:hypothetical protein